MSRLSKRVATPAVVALQLLGAWNRIAQGHVALSTGCWCGVAVSTLRVQDFEHDILEFLRARHGGACSGSSIAELLGAIARSDDPGAQALLADLRGSIASFQEQHSGR